MQNDLISADTRLNKASVQIPMYETKWTIGKILFYSKVFH